MKAKKNPVGRPTKYKPEFCEALIAHMRKGFSFESFGCTVGVARDAVFEWCKTHKEFSDAKRMALDLNLLFWERLGVEGLWNSEDSKFNTTLWIFNMKNRHGWRDTKDLNLAATISRDEDVDKALDGVPQKNVIELLRSGRVA